MTNIKPFSIALVCIFILSIGGIILMNNTNVFQNWENTSLALLKQYLKVSAFLCIMGGVYVWMKLSKKEDKESLEE